MRTKTSVAGIAAALLLSACASRPDDISAAYVSPLPYQQLDCQQLAAEAQRVSASAAVANGAQSQQAANDAVATAVAVVVFWPALFLIKGDNAKAAEVARLKGEMQAIEQASIAKQCGIQFKGGPAAAPAVAAAKAAPAAPGPAKPASAGPAPPSPAPPNPSPPSPAPASPAPSPAPSATARPVAAPAVPRPPAAPDTEATPNG